jgi:hypothetical protein
MDRFAPVINEGKRPYLLIRKTDSKVITPAPRAGFSLAVLTPNLSLQCVA